MAGLQQILRGRSAALEPTSLHRPNPPNRGAHAPPGGRALSIPWRTPWQAKPRTHPSGCRASRSMPQPIPTSSVRTTKLQPRQQTYRQTQASPRPRIQPAICQDPGGPPRPRPPSTLPITRRSPGRSGRTRCLMASKARRRSSTPTSKPSPCCAPSSGKDVRPLPMNASRCCASPDGAASRRASTSTAPTPRGSSAPGSCRKCSNRVSTSRPGRRSTTATTPSPSSSAGSGRHCAAWASRADTSWTPAAASATFWAACRPTSPREAASPRSNWMTWPGASSGRCTAPWAWTSGSRGWKPRRWPTAPSIWWSRTFRSATTRSAMAATGHTAGSASTTGSSARRSTSCGRAGWCVSSRRPGFSTNATNRPGPTRLHWPTWSAPSACRKGRSCGWRAPTCSQTS